MRRPLELHLYNRGGRGCVGFLETVLFDIKCVYILTQTYLDHYVVVKIMPEKYCYKYVSINEIETSFIWICILYNPNAKT